LPIQQNLQGSDFGPGRKARCRLDLAGTRRLDDPFGRAGRLAVARFDSRRFGAFAIAVPGLAKRAALDRPAASGAGRLVARRLRKFIQRSAGIILIGDDALFIAVPSFPQQARPLEDHAVLVTLIGAEELALVGLLPALLVPLLPRHPTRFDGDHL